MGELTVVDVLVLLIMLCGLAIGGLVAVSVFAFKALARAGTAIHDALGAVSESRLLVHQAHEALPSIKIDPGPPADPERRGVPLAAEEREEMVRRIAKGLINEARTDGVTLSEETARDTAEQIIVAREW